MTEIPSPDPLLPLHFLVHISHLRLLFRWLLGGCYHLIKSERFERSERSEKSERNDLDHGCDAKRALGESAVFISFTALPDVFRIRRTIYFSGNYIFGVCSLMAMTYLYTRLRTPDPIIYHSVSSFSRLTMWRGPPLCLWVCPLFLPQMFLSGPPIVKKQCCFSLRHEG